LIVKPISAQFMMVIKQFSYKTSFENFVKTEGPIFPLK